MKIKAKYVIAVLFLILALATNPSAGSHKAAIVEGSDRLGGIPDKECVQRCELHDFYVFSYVSYLNKPISVGFLNNIFLCYSNLEHILEGKSPFKPVGFSCPARGAPKTSG